MSVISCYCTFINQNVVDIKFWIYIFQMNPEILSNIYVFLEMILKLMNFFNCYGYNLLHFAMNDFNLRIMQCKIPIIRGFFLLCRYNISNKIGENTLVFFTMNQFKIRQFIFPMLAQIVVRFLYVALYNSFNATFFANSQRYAVYQT